MKNSIIRTYKRFKRSEFFINVVKLFTGTATGQLIAILLAPVLYRLYEPESFGIFALFFAVSSVLSSLSTLQYSQLVLLERSEKSAITALGLCRFLNITVSVLILSLIFLILPFLETSINDERHVKWLWLLPLSICLTGQNEVLCIWGNRCKRYNILVVNGIIFALVTPIISISLAQIFSGETGLFIGLFTGQVSSFLFLWSKLGRKKKFFERENFRLMKVLCFENKKFPLFLMPSELINRVNNHLPIFLLSTFFGPSFVGLYSLSVKILEMPLRFVGNAIGNVFRQKASQDYHEIGTCRRTFLKTSLILLCISALPAILIGSYAPEIFEVFFGEKWRRAGIYAQLLAVMVFFKLIVSPVSYVFFIYKRLKEDFILHIYMLASSWLILNFFYSRGNLESGIFGFACNYSAIYIYTWVRSYRFTHTKITI